MNRSQSAVLTQKKFFTPCGTLKESETTTVLTPHFNADGLIPCIAIDARNQTVLMLAWMNAEALAKTIETRQAHYWSRSRNALWRKGESSGATQHVVNMWIDCDQDSVLIAVDVADAVNTCHTGRPTCFFRSIPLGRVPAPGMRLEAENFS